MSCVTWHLLMLGRGLTGVSVCVFVYMWKGDDVFMDVNMWFCLVPRCVSLCPLTLTLPNRRDNAAGKSHNSKVWMKIMRKKCVLPPSLVPCDHCVEALYVSEICLSNSMWFEAFFMSLLVFSLSLLITTTTKKSFLMSLKGLFWGIEQSRKKCSPVQKNTKCWFFKSNFSIM